MTNKERILAELLQGEKSTGQLCKALGYVKDGIPQYKVIEKDLKTLYSRGFLSRRKGKTGGRPGTFWKIKKTIPTLCRLWRDYPNLRPEIFSSPLYHSLIPEITQEIVPKIVREASGVDSLSDELLFEIELALQNSFMFANLVLSGWFEEHLREALCDDDIVHFKFLKFANRIRMIPAAPTPVEEMARRVDIFKEIEYEIVSHVISSLVRTYIPRFLRHPADEDINKFVELLWESGHLSNIDTLLILNVYKYRKALGIAGSSSLFCEKRFNPFLWLILIPPERKEQILDRLEEKVLHIGERRKRWSPEMSPEFINQYLSFGRRMPERSLSFIRRFYDLAGKDDCRLGDFKCVYCEMCFETSEELKSHLLSEHREKLTKRPGRLGPEQYAHYLSRRASCDRLHRLINRERSFHLDPLLKEYILSAARSQT